MDTGILSILEGFIKQVEGFLPTPVWDFKQWSWGYGTAAGYNKNLKPSGSITRDRATKDALEVHKKNYAYLKPFVKIPLTDSQWAAVLSFAYNAGPGAAKSELVTPLNRKDWNTVALRMKNYNRAGGKVNDGLINRRKKEVSLFLNGSTAGIGILLTLVIVGIVFYYLTKIKQ